MAVRASDQITLQHVATPTYIRTYYRLQSSTLTPPAAPTTNPPASPWSTTEPAYSPGSTDTLYTVQLTVWGDQTFQYGPVQKASSYEAAKQAYNAAQAASQTAATADGRITVSTNAPTTANGTGKPVGAVWFRKSGATFIGVWEWTGSAWQSRTLTDATLANLDVGKLTAGEAALATVVAQKIAGATGQFIELDVSQLRALEGVLDEAVIQKLWSDVVVQRMSIAEQFIGENAILSGAVTADKLHVDEAFINKLFVNELLVQALTGKTITGALIRTAASGQRVETAANRLSFFDEDGNLAGDILGAREVSASDEVLRSGVRIGGGTFVGNWYDRETGRSTSLSTPDTLRAGGTVFGKGFTQIGDDGGFRSLPFAMAAGEVEAANVVAGGTNKVTITFPAGRFTVTPVVTATIDGDARDTTIMVLNRTPSSFTLSRGSMSTVTRSIGATWTAVQMTEGSAAG